MISVNIEVQKTFLLVLSAEPVRLVLANCLVLQFVHPWTTKTNKIIHSVMHSFWATKRPKSCFSLSLPLVLHRGHFPTPQIYL